MDTLTAVAGPYNVFINHLFLVYILITIIFFTRLKSIVQIPRNQPGNKAVDSLISIIAN